MKTYVAETGFRNCRVHVRDETSTRELGNRGGHSPDGHGWGYGGSGPSQLAFDMLVDVYGEEPSPRLYQSFKQAVLAHLDEHEGFELSEMDVRAWVNAQGGFERARQW